MAVYEMNIYSQKLYRMVSAIGILPTDGQLFYADRKKECYERPMKTAYLLSGFSKDEKAWLYGSRLMRYCYKYNIAAFLPAGENSFYIDAERRGALYEQYVAQELVKYTRETFRNISDRREDTIVGGISMGGYGALYLGLRHPETFGSILSLSPGILTYDYPDHAEKLENMGFPMEYLSDVFGNVGDIDKKGLDLESLYQKKKSSGTEMPHIYLACGSEDFVLDYSRKFSEFLKREKANFRYNETPGGHEWDFWEKHTEKGFEWIWEAAK